MVWQLDTGKRKYKPRLGSPLLYFVDSPDPSLSCVRHQLYSYNCVRFVLLHNLLSATCFMNLMSLMRI